MVTQHSDILSVRKVNDFDFQWFKSSRNILLGGGPQGAYLGDLIFIIKYNGAFLRPPIPRPFQGPVSKAKSKKVKFVNYGSVAVSVDLKSSLFPDPMVRPRPLNFHERTGHNLLHYNIRDTEQFVQETECK